MAYTLNPNAGDSIAVPQLVISRLPLLSENRLRVALYIISSNCTDPAKAAAALSLPTAAVNDAFLYWEGAGLISKTACVVPEEVKPVRAPRLTTRQTVLAAKENPEITVLLTECQNILGTAFGETDGNILASLYINDNIPVDLILTATAHFVSLGKRNVRYIERALLSWQEDGITTVAHAEAYLKKMELRAKNEQIAASLLGINNPKFTTAERTIIAQWFEDMGFDEQMVQEACIYAGEKLTVRYVNGILRNWFTKGLKTVRQVRAQNGGNNILVANRAAAPAQKQESHIMRRNIGKEIDFSE
ncbi:MAG: DnaD domain protein [Oscillospiraceae bacterium]|nr:DnaD domain protein [Oscillospiraceae bacterium]